MIFDCWRRSRKNVEVGDSSLAFSSVLDVNDPKIENIELPPVVDEV